MKHFLTIAVSALALSACATKPYIPTLYDASSAQVRSIAIVDDSIPDELGANELASASGTGQAVAGIVGYLVVGAMEGIETNSRVNALKTLMQSSGFDAEAEFEKMLSAKLAAAGFQNMAVVGGPRNKRKPIKDYPASPADALLDVQMTNFGMQKAVTGQEWRPASAMIVKLVSTKDDSILVENTISYNSGLTSGAMEGMIYMSPSDTSVGFMKIKDMTAPEVAAQMRIMLDEVSSTIVALLR